MLVANRVCVRCSVTASKLDNDGIPVGYRDIVTRWTNEHDEGLEVACTVCGLTAASPLTDDEAARVAALDAKPVKRRRRHYVVL